MRGGRRQGRGGGQPRLENRGGERSGAVIYYEGVSSADGSDEGDVREALAVEELASEEEEQVTVGWRGLVEGDCLERRVVERSSTEERLEWWRKERACGAPGAPCGSAAGTTRTGGSPRGAGTQGAGASPFILDSIYTTISWHMGNVMPRQVPFLR